MKKFKLFLRYRSKTELFSILTSLLFLFSIPVLDVSKMETAFLGVLAVFFILSTGFLIKSQNRFLEGEVKLRESALELKKTLETLDATNALLENTSKMAKVGGWELDLGTGRVEMSKETQRMHEIDENYEPPLYNTGAQWYPPEAWPMIKSAVEDAIQKGKSYDLESPFITAKNRTIWVRVQGFPVMKEGKVTHLRGTFQDISERKQKDIENKFVGEALGFGVWKFDPVKNSLEWDERMYSLYGLKAEDFSGAYAAWENALTPRAKDDAVKELGLALSGEKEFNTEFEIKLKNGETRHIAGRAVVIRNEKKEPIKMYGLNWDVTQRVRAEQELKAANLRLIQTSKLASLGEMSAGIAHEINNPLAIISATVELMSKLKDNPEKWESKIEFIKKSCTRIARIVGGLKKFSRTGDQTVVFRPQSLSEIAREAMILTDVKSKKHYTPVTLECSIPAKILCGEVEIEQVIVNMVSNAIDAVQERAEKWVKIAIFEEGNSVVMRITDSGLGIPEHVRSKIFDPFFTTKKVGEGTGLGLSITKGIIDEHKGSITVLVNCPNTCFEIKFPKAEALSNAA
jgi:PAS domain S-box-containing protein